MGKVALALVGLLLAALPGMAQTDAHLYSPGANLERSELAQLDTATRTLDVAMYSFTDRELAEELAILARKGVRVRVYRDREQFSQEEQSGAITTTGILLAAGVAGPSQRPTGSHAPQELCDRRSLAAYGLRELVSDRTQAPGQRSAVRVIAGSRGAL